MRLRASYFGCLHAEKPPLLCRCGNLEPKRFSLLLCCKLFVLTVTLQRATQHKVKSGAQIRIYSEQNSDTPRQECLLIPCATIRPPAASFAICLGFSYHFLLDVIVSLRSHFTMAILRLPVSPSACCVNVFFFVSAAKRPL